MQQTTTKVAHILDENNLAMAACTEHHGYFIIPSQDIRQKMEDAQKTGQEISFLYDSHLNILRVL